MFGRIIIGILVIACGFFCAKHSMQIRNFFGDFDFAEKFLGTGGTVSFWKLLGILAMIFGILHIFGMTPEFLTHKIQNT
jgi:hypothetical protein